MKPFDIEAAKAGAAVQTARGNPVRILTFDRAHEFPIMALETMPNGRERIIECTIDGVSRQQTFQGYTQQSYNLVMVPTTKYKVTVEVTFESEYSAKLMYARNLGMHNTRCFLEVIKE